MREIDVGRKRNVAMNVVDDVGTSKDEVAAAIV